jgi:hypothetical protein
MKIKSIPFILLFVSLCVQDASFAQNNTSSPYSSRGYGEIEPFVNVFSRGMGGVSNGIRTNRTISLSNPASLGALNQVSLDFAFRGDYGEVYNQSAKKTSYNGNFNYFSLGFPVYRKPEVKTDTSKRAEQNKLYKEYHTIWSSAIGLTPYSNVNASYFKTLDTSYGTVANYYLKTGGLNKVFFMNAVNLTRHFSIGLNTSFIFGQVRSNEAFFIQDSGITRATYNDRNAQISGFHFDLGIQGDRNKDTIVWYDSATVNNKRVLRKRTFPVRFVYGATFSNRNSLNYNIYRLSMNKSNYYTSAPIDTVVNENNVRGKTFMPMSFSAGFSVTFNNKWMIAADYRSDRWADVGNSQLLSDSFSNSSQINIGFAYRPDLNVDQMDVRRISGKRRIRPNLEYRLGARLLNTGYLFKDNVGVISPLKEYGISFGIGIPKLRDDYNGKKVLVKSMFNITGEYIHRGTTNNGMIAENLYRLTIGFTLSDIWFKQRKFN